jgi:hypothetical protein
VALTKISAGVIAANAVVDSFGTQSITGDKIGLTAINANNIVNSSITGDKIGLTAINANNIVNGTITTTQIASNTVSNTNIATGAIENYLNATGLGFGMRNRIINGTMMIDQRNAGANVTVNTDSNFYAVDRFNVTGQSSDGVFSIQRDTVAPTGFTNSLKITTTTADSSIGASQRYIVRQPIEGFNVADLGFGSANAQTITVSFQIRSSLTGTFGGSILNAAQNRSYPFSFTISVANTFETKTVTIQGDTTGTWLTNNDVGMFLVIDLGCGSSLKTTANSWAAGQYYGVTGGVNLVGTLNATMYLTGVQLEKGSTATSFDYRPYGTELALCQRYYQQVTGGSMGVTYNTTSANWGQAFPVQMRASPTCAVSAALSVDELGVAIRTQSSSHIQTTGNGISPEAFNVFTENFSSFTAGRPVALITTGGKFTFSAEL